jgi:hypothetical protein
MSGHMKVSELLAGIGEPLALRIVLTRDLDNMTIAPRIPGIQRVIDRACAREFARVEGDLGTAIR